jgi:hypothetical protein
VESAESITVGVEAILCVKLSVERLSLKDHLSNYRGCFVKGFATTWDIGIFIPLVVQWSGHIDKREHATLALVFQQAGMKAL